MRIHIFVFVMLALISSPLMAENPAGDNLASAASYGSCLASQNQGLLQSQNINYMEAQEGGGEKYYPRYKSESTAFLLAFVPGFFIHGMGHFYAGDFKTGLILFGLELLIIPGAAAEIAYDLAENKDPDDKGNVAHAAFAVGLAAFFVSWVIDIAHSSVAVEKYNNKVRAQIYYSSDRGDDIQVGLTLKF